MSWLAWVIARMNGGVQSALSLPSLSDHETELPLRKKLQFRGCLRAESLVFYLLFIRTLSRIIQELGIGTTTNKNRTNQ